MRKWTFWIFMCFVSVLNGAFFFMASANSMRQGISGGDNQAALLFIPMLWIAAGFVLVMLNLYTLIRGITIEKDRIVRISDIFKLSGLSRRTRLGRISFFVITGLLMLFGYGLFALDAVLSIAYAFSGGMLLVLLYAWKMAGLQGAVQRRTS